RNCVACTVLREGCSSPCLLYLQGSVRGRRQTLPLLGKFSAALLPRCDLASMPLSVTACALRALSLSEAQEEPPTRGEAAWPKFRPSLPRGLKKWYARTETYPRQSASFKPLSGETTMPFYTKGDV